MSSKKVIIIGGGLSGLFLGEELYNSGIRNFLIIENRAHVGGFASWGDMKIGLLPAGRKTADYLGSDQFRIFSDEFMDRHNHSLQKIDSLNKIGFNSKTLQNKYYESLVFPQTKSIQLVNFLYYKLKEHIIFSAPIHLSKPDDLFIITLSNGLKLQSEYLVGAYGRWQNFPKLLESIGESFVNPAEYLLGLRATFRTVDFHHLFNHQVDFKAKDSFGCQTYCFNVRGYLQSYDFDQYRIFCGSLNDFSSIGNVFLGKKVQTPFGSLNLKVKTGKIRDYQNDLIVLNEDIDHHLNNFIENFCTTFKVDFESYFYPALEQFWKRPVLNPGKLSSKAINKLFYVGESSGVAFGFLQNYVTMKIVSREIGR